MEFQKYFADFLILFNSKHAGLVKNGFPVLKITQKSGHVKSEWNLFQ